MVLLGGGNWTQVWFNNIMTSNGRAESFLGTVLLCYLPYSHATSLVAQTAKSAVCNAGRPGFDPWVRKIPWRREWLPDPVFLPEEFRRRTWQATVHGVTKSQTQLND